MHLREDLFLNPQNLLPNADKAFQSNTVSTPCFIQCRDNPAGFNSKSLISHLKNLIDSKSHRFPNSTQPSTFRKWLLENEPVWPGSSDPSKHWCHTFYVPVYVRLLQRRLGAPGHKSHQTHYTVNQSRTPASEGCLGNRLSYTYYSAFPSPRHLLHILTTKAWDSGREPVC